MRMSMRMSMARGVRLLALVGLFAAAPALAQNSPAEQKRDVVEQRNGGDSPEGGAYGAGPDVNESESQGIINWFSWDYGPNAKDRTHRGWPPPFFYALLNFAIFLGIMYKLAWPPLKQMMLTRHDTIGRNLREAAELHRQAELELKKYQEKVAGIDGEIDALLAQIRKEALLEKERIITNAENEAKRLKVDAERQIAAEIDRARRELRRGVIEAAVAAADESLKKNIGADDQRKMAEHYVAEVEAHSKPIRSRS